MNNLLNIKLDPKAERYSRQNFSCIYKITSKMNNKCYIGSAKHFGIRRRNHVFQLENNKHHSIILQHHVDKYGILDIYFEILELVQWDANVYKREQYFIDKFNPYFNVCRIANSSFGKIVSKESRLKMREAQLGKKQSEETKAKKNAAVKETLSHLSKEKMNNRKKGGKLKAKKIICCENGIIYNSITEAELITGCDNISQIIKGSRNKSLGLTFKFYI